MLNFLRHPSDDGMHTVVPLSRSEWIRYIDRIDY